MEEIYYTDYWALQKGPEESQSHMTEFSNNLYLNMWRLKCWKIEVEIAFHECARKHQIYVWSIRFMCASRNYTHSQSILYTLNLKRRKKKSVCCRSQKKEKKVADLKVKWCHLSILKYSCEPHWERSQNAYPTASILSFVVTLNLRNKVQLTMRGGVRIKLQKFCFGES